MKNFISAFKDGEKISWPLVAIFLIVNAIVLYNAIFHNPAVQYDSTGHLMNIRVIAMGRLPTPTESGEYFSAPLAYLLPAGLISAAGLPLLQALKVAQLVDFLLSLILTFTLLKIADTLFPGRIAARLISLGMLALLPVYYRTFAYVRGEPFVACLTLVAVYLSIQIFARRRADWPRVITLGVILGIDILARQWAFFFFPALLAFVLLCAWAGETQFKAALVRVVAIILLAALLGGWFYVSLYQNYGTLTAFNRKPGEQNLGNQPVSFYTGLGLNNLFSKPVRPLLNNRLLPILYSDTWGDYWGYFLVYVIDSRSGSQVAGSNFENAISGHPPAWISTNYDSFGTYLGSVNAIAVVPSLIFLAGLLYGIWELLRYLRPEGKRPPLDGSALLTLTAIFALAGYFWFLVTYPSASSGSATVKATYIIQVYPVLALLVANLFEKLAFLRARQKWLWLLGLAFLYDFSAFITHFNVQPWK